MKKLLILSVICSLFILTKTTNAQKILGKTLTKDLLCKLTFKYDTTFRYWGDGVKFNPNGTFVKFSHVGDGMGVPDEVGNYTIMDSLVLLKREKYLWGGNQELADEEKETYNKPETQYLAGIQDTPGDLYFTKHLAMLEKDGNEAIVIPILEYRRKAGEVLNYNGIRIITEGLDVFPFAKENILLSDKPSKKISADNKEENVELNGQGGKIQVIARTEKQELIAGVTDYWYLINVTVLWDVHLEKWVFGKCWEDETGNYSSSDDDLIVGRWLANANEKIEFVFTKDGKCMQYTEGKLEKTTTYEVKLASEGLPTLVFGTKEKFEFSVNEAELTIKDKDKTELIFTRKIE